MTAQQDMRAEFESEIRKHGYGALNRRADNGCYEHAPTEHAWQGWQVCRQYRQQEIDRLRDAIEKSLVILNMLDREIPKTMGEVNLDLLHKDILEAREALTAQQEAR